jgi:hypothetical protein
MHVPGRKDLFERARSAFGATVTAIETYRQAQAGVLQNPGLPVNDATLQAFYESYVGYRQDVFVALQTDIAAVDQLFAEIVQAIQATHGQQPPPPGEALQIPVSTPEKTYVLRTSHPTPEKEKKRRAAPTPAETTGSGDWEQALQTIADTLELLDQLPEEAEDFTSSVTEKLTNMRSWIESRGRVTPKMESAIENMHRGALKWLERDD